MGDKNEHGSIGGICAGYDPQCTGTRPCDGAESLLCHLSVGCPWAHSSPLCIHKIRISLHVFCRVVEIKWDHRYNA